MGKFTRSPITSGYRSYQKFNENLAAIEDAIQDTLSRTGSTPNQMEATLDMNSNKIINLAAPEDMNDAARLQDVLDYAGSGGGGGGGPVTWSSITGKPSTFTPTTEDVQDIMNTTLQAGTNVSLSYDDLGGSLTVNSLTSTEEVQDIVGDMVVAGSNITATYNDSTGKLTIAASGSGGTSYFKTLKDYGSVEDGVTDDKAAIDAAIADSTTKRVYIEGNVATTNVITDLTKHFYGPGRLTLTTSSNKKLPARFTDITSLPTQGSGSDLNYYFSSDIGKIDAEYIRLGQPTGGTNFRQNLTKSIGGAFPYYEASTTPHFWVFQNYVGWSGVNALTMGAITSGSTTSVTLNNSDHGLTTGDTVGFVYTDGTITETKVVTISGTTMSWTGTLTQTYPTGSAVTKGFRTMNPMQYTKVDHYGGGDSYANISRITIGYTPLAAQSHFYMTSTGGIGGGDLAFTASGNYGTGYELQFTDNGFDVAVIGDVYSYNRTNNTGAKAVGWFGTLHKSEGSVPINAFHVINGKGDVGFDASQGIFGANQAAFQMASDHRFYFNATLDNALTTKMGSSVYSALYGNAVGNSYVHHKENGGLDSRGKRIEFVVNGALSSAGYGTMNIRGSYIEAHKTFSIYRTNGTASMSLDPSATQLYFYDSSGTDFNVGVARVTDSLILQTKADVTVQDTGSTLATFSGSGTRPGISLPINKHFTLFQNSKLYLDGGVSNTYLSFTGTNIILVKNGTTVGTW